MRKQAEKEKVKAGEMEKEKRVAEWGRKSRREMKRDDVVGRDGGMAGVCGIPSALPSTSNLLNPFP